MPTETHPVYVLFSLGHGGGLGSAEASAVSFYESEAKELVKSGRYLYYEAVELLGADRFEFFPVRDPRTLLIDAICGIKVLDMDTCDKLTRLGYMEFCGNQWNEEWRWVRKNLEHAQMEMLEKIYNTFRLKRNEVIEDILTEEEREELDYLYGNKN